MGGAKGESRLRAGGQKIRRSGLLIFLCIITISTGHNTQLASHEINVYLLHFYTVSICAFFALW